MKNKKLLILKASEDVEEDEILNIISQTSMYGIEVVREDIQTLEDLISVLNSGETYDFIYLATHGNEECFGNLTGSLSIPWLQFAAEICKSGCTNNDSIFLQSCCRGGLSKVAYEMFYCCDKIQYVCGPRQNMLPVELVMAFNIFLFNVVVRRMDPIVASQKVLAATDIRLVCYDRLETETESDYKKHCEIIKPDVQRYFGFIDLDDKQNGS